MRPHAATHPYAPSRPRWAVLSVGALLLGRVVQGLLFGVQPSDPVSMALSAVVLGGVALGAALVPALRATRVHPSEALKAE